MLHGIGLHASRIPKYRCQPRAVLTISVRIKSPCCATSLCSVARPASPSTSMTTIPDIAPVAIPMFASGHFRHHASICRTSVVAALKPPLTRGCLPAFLPQSRPHVHRPSCTECKGKACHPRPAYRRANCSIKTVIAPSPCARFSPLFSPAGSPPCGKAIGPSLQIGSGNQRFFANLADRNLAAGNQLIKFRAADPCQPAALVDRKEQFVHGSLAIVGRDGPRRPGPRDCERWETMRATIS
jgi:hypothetical protein